jgi:DNA-binding NarL/FixJ family response regulator
VTKLDSPVLIRPFTARQEQIALAIGRGLTYAEIAGELARVDGKYVSPNTIRQHVRNMATLIDGADELAPRWRIYVLVKQVQWATRGNGSAPTTTE